MILVGLVLTAILVAWAALGSQVKLDPREPPLVPPRIPVIGHLIGLWRKTFRYYIDVSQRSGQPIFTMMLPGQKMYVVTQPDLIQKVQKQHKVISFRVVESQLSSRLCGVSQRTIDIVNSRAKHGTREDVAEEFYMLAHEILGTTGESLDEMTQTAITHTAQRLEQLRSKEGRHDLYALVKPLLMQTTSRATWGPLSPYNDPEVADGFLDFEAGLMSLIIGIAPTVTARKPLLGRERAADAFCEFFAGNGIKQASSFIQKRYDLMSQLGIPLRDLARFEIALAIAVFSNLIPTCFWTLLHIISDSQLLADIRSEIDGCTATSTEAGSTTKMIDITMIKSHCPLFMSTYQEVMRYRSIGTSARAVTKDTYLDDYLLKKGALLMIPAPILHQNSAIWGDVGFNPQRFMPGGTSQKVRASWDRSFGGGKTLCPGRHFATNQVLAFVALFTAQFDVEPAGGKWVIPTGEKTSPANFSMTPDFDVPIELRVRRGHEKVRWAVRS